MELKYTQVQARMNKGIRLDEGDCEIIANQVRQIEKIRVSKRKMLGFKLKYVKYWKKRKTNKIKAKNL